MTEPPEKIDVLSMAPMLLGQPRRQQKHEFRYWEFQEKQAVRMGDWKAVRMGAEDGGLERHALSERHPAIIASLKQIMKTSHDAPRH